MSLRDLTDQELDDAIKHAQSNKSTAIDVMDLQAVSYWSFRLQTLVDELICRGNPEYRNQTCALCGGLFDGPGHNPEPLQVEGDGRACNDCNGTRVIPARIAWFRSDRTEEEEEEEKSE